MISKLRKNTLKTKGGFMLPELHIMGYCGLRIPIKACLSTFKNTLEGDFA